MAFTAVHYATDKDQVQLPVWGDNDELASTADNFFDQFVTFDAGDVSVLNGEVMDDPPSPSILLDSLQEELASSASNPLASPSLEPWTGAVQSTESDFLTFEPYTSPQETQDPDLLAALVGDPVLSNGSISDSELLRLEGISLKSPRGSLTAPSSPPAPTPIALSPRKHNRFVDSVYATIRRATHRSKPVKQDPYQSIDMTNFDAFIDGSNSGLELFDSNLDHFADPGTVIKREPVDSHGLPLSPPLTGKIPQDGRSASSAFVTGHLDDPFCDDMLAPPPIVLPKGRQEHTPLNTPNLNDEMFYQNQASVAALDSNTLAYRPSVRSMKPTSSAEWPMEGLLTDSKYTDDPALWSSSSSAAFLGDNGSLSSPEWWDAALAGEMPQPQPDHASAAASGRNTAAQNLSIHNQQSELPYEYYSELSGSGLMIHMPQPRPPPASVLSANINEQLLATPTTSGYNLQRTPSLSHTHPHSRHHGHTERRPRPRAPSSGARHHGALTSPRKMHHSLSRGYLREESTSPSPMARHPHHQSSHQERHQQRSSSLTMRKRRSFSRRSGTEPRTPSSGSTSFASNSAEIGFVNFTPSDKNVLMTGVAPSGSSKTKARREKEAMEKSRRISEAAYRAVQDAGGDVNKLIGQFTL
ncbi:hypothetical protein GGR57DRAFT_228629 [Xylariaceae sp. FL1272]|nr:hypothetical protein GGR57DRAFT_228629 [Xylariaceae sp. FL1272]